MPQRITPAKIETRTITQEGEVHLLITLDINLNLNSDGLKLSINGTNASSVTQEEDKVHYPIPDFSSGNGLSFGKSLNG